MVAGAGRTGAAPIADVDNGGTVANAIAVESLKSSSGLFEREETNERDLFAGALIGAHEQNALENGAKRFEQLQQVIWTKEVYGMMSGIKRTEIDGVKCTASEAGGKATDKEAIGRSGSIGRGEIGRGIGSNSIESSNHRFGGNDRLREATGDGAAADTQPVKRTHGGLSIGGSMKENKTILTTNIAHRIDNDTRRHHWPYSVGKRSEAGAIHCGRKATKHTIALSTVLIH